MGWWGKIIGGIMGYGVARIPGAVLGVLLGHSFDKGLDRVAQPMSADQQQQLQDVFFNATFVVMGRMAKADGRVSEKEIAAAEHVMQRMGLTGSMRQKAIDLFQSGKQEDFDWEGELRYFSNLCSRQRSLKQMFLEIQIQAAFADGPEIHENEVQLLQVIAKELGFPKLILDQLIAIVRAQHYFYQQNGYSQSSGQSHASSQSQLERAYQVLGIESSASDSEVKRAYRRLMSQHHPDKLVAKGLPEQMIKMATEKTQEIKHAYETIKRERGES